MTNTEFEPISTLIPVCVDRLPCSPFHTRMVVALGVALVLDGLEIAVAGDVADLRRERIRSACPHERWATSRRSISLASWSVSSSSVDFRTSLDEGGSFSSRWGCICGARGLTAATFGHRGASVIWLYATQFTADMGIGGEYAAINSAIDEMIPAWFRGRVDIAINGTYWGGALLGALAELYIPKYFSDIVSWRLGFLLGPVLAVAIVIVRRNLPESHRWLVIHGREKEAEEAIRHTEGEQGDLSPLGESNALVINPIADLGYFTQACVLFTQIPKRSILGATLMITQSFLYNAIFFTYALVLSSVYHISTGSILLYFIAFTVGNLAGPILLGKLFDTIGRRFMISSTCLLAGVLLAFIAWAFDANLLDALTQTIALSLAFFFAIAQAFGALGPNIYGGLVNNHRGLFFAYLVGPVS